MCFVRTGYTPWQGSSSIPSLPTPSLLVTLKEVSDIFNL